MANLVVSNLNDIREVFGYIEANKVQEEVNYILKRNTYKDELLFKACNDDFVMMLKFSAKTETVSRMNKIINEVNDRYDMKKSEYPVILSIGLYVSKSEDSNMDAMMQKSLQARRHIKERDITRFMFFEETMNIITIEENLLQQEFVNSIEKDDFLIYIQPKVSLKDNSICGGEILSRWYNPRRGLIRPGEYIPVFEKSGKIINFDIYMFEKACQLISRSIKSGKRVVPVAVNFARSHFTDSKFCDDILIISKRYDVSAHYLNIEVTESLISENPKVMNDIVKKLKALGFSISLDDFGTGYASFSDLSQYSIDYVKLDKSMMYNLESSKTRKMIKGITDIAHNMDMKVICEGVETKQQVDLLRQLDCDIIQGFIFYQSMPYEEFEKILQSV
jgi:EAL domain-containing protein (putative c-di-GMP-specific phosphodiesterase class I)